MPAFLNRIYFCHKCLKGYHLMEEHKCNNPCVMCRKIHEDKEENYKYCSNCHLRFKGKECYDVHKKESDEGNLTCKKYYRCTDCSQVINRKKQKKEHKCGEVFCKTHDDYFLPGHQCYMKTKYLDQLVDKTVTYIFWDFECTQDDVFQCEKGYKFDPLTKRCINCKKSKYSSLQHKPNLCVAHKVCSLCIDKEVTSDRVCQKCVKNETIFSEDNTADDFCNWLFSK